MGYRAEWDQWLLDARAGDALALGSLLEAAREDLHAAAAGVLGHTARRQLPVDDVFEEAMIAALRELRSLRATSYMGFRFWFASIARNHVCRAIRRERSRPRVAGDSEHEADDDESPEQTLEVEDQQHVRNALVGLPQTQQVAFILREGLGLHWHTIGFVLERRGIPAARLIHYRAMQRMKYVLGACADVRPLELRVAEA